MRNQRVVRENLNSAIMGTRLRWIVILQRGFLGLPLRNTTNPPKCHWMGLGLRKKMKNKIFFLICPCLFLLAFTCFDMDGTEGGETDRADVLLLLRVGAPPLRSSSSFRSGVPWQCCRPRPAPPTRLHHPTASIPTVVLLARLRRPHSSHDCSASPHAGHGLQHDSDAPKVGHGLHHGSDAPKAGHGVQ